MTYEYRAPDGEPFLQKQNALRHIAEQKNCRIVDAEEHLEEINQPEKEDEETLEVFKFRIVEHWSAERMVTVKATEEDLAEERAKDAMLNREPELTHKMHTEVQKLDKVDEVPRSEIETGEYWEEDQS